MADLFYFPLKQKCFGYLKKKYVSKCEYRFNIKHSHYTAKAEVVPNFSVANSAEKTILVQTYLCTHVSHRLVPDCDIKNYFSF